MEEEQQYLPGFELPGTAVGESAAAKRWMQELGVSVESLAHMMRKPTETRPFIYEVRFDLVPAKSNDTMLVAKGFGAEGGVVTFHNSGGFLELLRGFEGVLRAGKSVWYPDKFQSDTYSQRLSRYRSEEFYLR